MRVTPQTDAPGAHDPLDPVEAAEQLWAVSVVDALRIGGGAVRLGAEAGWRVAEWYLRGSAEITRRLVQGAAEGESAPQLVAEVVEQWRDQIRDLLGIEELADLTRAPSPVVDEALDEVALRARGAELLRRSADVSYAEPFHPGYGRILDLLAPDAARVLRLLYVDGAQPTVDVRTASPLPGSSELLAPGLSMVAASAGCRFHDRVPAYLNNLFRLGLVWFSREAIDDLVRCQVRAAGGARGPGPQQAVAHCASQPAPDPLR